MLEAELGGTVVEAVSQEEGFSPGMAARCRLDDGRRVFIKAVTSALNADSRRMALHELTINRILPPDAPAPRLLASVDDGSWVAAAWADIDGRLPRSSWPAGDLALVIDAVDGLALQPQDGVRTAVEQLGPSFDGWRRLAKQRARGIEHWLDQPALDHLAEIEAGWEAFCPPDALIHVDLRADNMLIDADDRVWIVDWANAALGPSWFDVLGMIPAMAMQSGRAAAELWAMSRHATSTDPAAVDALAVAISGYFTYSARRPAIPAIPMLRDFQEAQAVPSRAWIGTRLGLN